MEWKLAKSEEFARNMTMKLLNKPIYSIPKEEVIKELDIKWLVIDNPIEVIIDIFKNVENEEINVKTKVKVKVFK